MTPELNCFNPEQHERLVLQALYYSQGPGFGTNENDCPVNWKIRNINGVDWVYLESWSKKPAWKDDDDLYRDANFSVWLMTPIFEDKYLQLVFTSTGSLPAQASNPLMFERIERIIQGLHLKLSPEAQKQKAQALDQAPSAQYSQHRDPEPWKYYTSYRPGDTTKGENILVFEGPCTPPPELS